MKIQDNPMNTGAGDPIIKNPDRTADDKQKNTTSKSINASELNDRLDPVGARLKSARNQAMKFIRDALAGELSIDDDMKKRNDHIGELAATINHAEGSIRKIDSEMAELKEKFEVDPDSQEEKDLQFLVNAERARAKSPMGELPPEVQEQVDSIKSNMTEYQERAYPLLLERDVHVDTLKDAKIDIRVENTTVRDMAVERLKSDPMGDAWDEANAVMEAASKDVVSMLVSEAQDNIDEDLEEKKEEAKEAEEAKEKLEERINATKEREKKQEELTEDILEAVSERSIKELDMSDPNSEINELVNKLKLIEYDVKGAVVDEEV